MKPDKAKDISTIAQAAVTKQFNNLLEKIKSGKISPAEMGVFNALEKRLKAENGRVEGLTYSRLVVAKHFKKTERTVSNWIRDGMPTRPDGGFCLADIQAWIDSKKQKKKGPGDETDIEFWKLQLKKHKSKLAELELKLKRGDLLVKADVMVAFREMQSYVKKHLALLPRTAPGKLVGLSAQDMQSVLSELTGAILTNMSKGQNASTLKGKLK